MSSLQLQEVAPAPSPLSGLPRKLRILRGAGKEGHIEVFFRVYDITFSKVPVLIVRENIF